MGGHENVIKYLINIVKVDIFKKDYENKTGLEHAWQKGHQTIVSWLSQLDININIQDYHNFICISFHIFLWVFCEIFLFFLKNDIFWFCFVVILNVL